VFLVLVRVSHFPHSSLLPARHFFKHVTIPHSLPARHKHLDCEFFPFNNARRERPNVCRREGALDFDMLSTVAVIGICVAVSVSFLFTGSIFAVWLLRIRDRKRTRLTSSLGRGLSTYCRAHLSIDGSNYSHVQQPRTSVRRSGQRPYGIVIERADRWTEVPSQESLRPQQMTCIEEQPEIDEFVPAPTRRRSHRQTLHGNSLNISKTRRQQKNEKAIAKNTLLLSPLSAITEFTDQSTTPNVAELPTSITPRQTPEKQRIGRPWGRPASIQWPLPLALRRPKDTPITEVKSIPARDAILIRKGSIDITSQLKRPSMGRSISMASAISDVPAGPLPPLPLGNVQRYSKQNPGTARRSNASLDTIGSSVLGSIPNSPARTNPYNPATPNMGLSSSGLHQFSPARARGSQSAIMIGIAAGRKAEQGTVKGSGTHSFRASIDEQASIRRVSNGRTVDRSDQRFKNAHLFEDSLKTIDARHWKPDLPSRPVSYRTAPSPSLPTPIARRPYDVFTAEHRSMFENKVLVEKRASNPVEGSAGEILTGSPRQLAPPRPASVASGNPYQWDLKPPLLFSVSPLPLKKGHRRQNCVRISNLPKVDPNRKSKLPEMMEEEEEEEGEYGNTPRIPGLTLLEVENGTPALRARASLVEIKASPSPFHNRPHLEPTSRKRASHQRRPSTESQGIPRPDSDVFTRSPNDPSTPTMFDEKRSGPRNWPLSPTPAYNIKLNSTPPTLSAIEEPYEPDSPMLPAPAITSATLFPRKSTVLLGPHTAPASARAPRNASPSPLNGRTAPKGDELRRSVMLLRAGNSEGKLFDHASRLYRNIGEQSMSNFSLPNANNNNNLGLASKSTTQMQGCSSTSDKPRGSNMALNSMMGSSRSKMSMAASPSMLSIWDDASVCDEGDLEGRNSMMLIPEQTTLGGQDSEAYENFRCQGTRYMARTASGRKDREREGRLTSPQGEGLGIRDWGTPVSLYDREGFLKEGVVM
jgi:hypothetical protein